MPIICFKGIHGKKNERMERRKEGKKKRRVERERNGDR